MWFCPFWILSTVCMQAEVCGGGGVDRGRRGQRCEETEWQRWSQGHQESGGGAAQDSQPGTLPLQPAQEVSPEVLTIISPGYNRNGWLGIKHLITYVLNNNSGVLERPFSSEPSVCPGGWVTVDPTPTTSPRSESCSPAGCVTQDPTPTTSPRSESCSPAGCVTLDPTPTIS